MKISKITKDNRNYGIDLLRIISMLYVVILHTLGRGGVLNASEVGSSQYMVAWLLEIWAFCAVNIFAIISGYVGYSDTARRTKYSSYIVMWLQVVTYGVVVTAIFNFINTEVVTIQDFFDMFFPVSNGLYWYFTAYTGLFFIMPLLNAAVRGCSEKQLKIILLSILIVYVCFDNIVHRFVMASGYSFIWLMLLYIIGAIIKKCNIGKNIKSTTALCGIVILVIISWLWKLYGFKFEIFGTIVNNNLLVSYTSPTIVIIALLYVVCFSKINFPKIFQKIIRFLSQGAFAVYIINNQRFIWDYVMNEKFSHLGTSSVLMMIGEVLLFSSVFVIISILIDHVRMLLFRFFRINYLAEKISDRVNNLLDKIKE